MMNLRQYDALRLARPFKAFRIHVSDGAKYDVPHPDFTWRMPAGSTIFVAVNDAAHFLDPLHITRFEMLPAAKKSKRKSA